MLITELWIAAAAVEAGELSWIEERAVLGSTSGPNQCDGSADWGEVIVVISALVDSFCCQWVVRAVQGAALGFANVDSGGDGVGRCGYSKSCHPIRECRCGAVATKVNDTVVKLVRSEMAEWLPDGDVVVHSKLRPLASIQMR